MSRGSLVEVYRIEGTGYGWTPGWLRALAKRPTSRAIVVGRGGIGWLSLAWIHWLGLVVGGALVGLASRSVRGAVAGGIGFGALVPVAHILASPVMGPTDFLGLAPLSFVTIATALVAPLWGSILRAVV